MLISFIIISTVFNRRDIDLSLANRFSSTIACWHWICLNLFSVICSLSCRSRYPLYSYPITTRRANTEDAESKFHVCFNCLYHRGSSIGVNKLLQESLWQQALDDIQREIEMKLDKVELAPIKDFFIKKMKQLQDHLKQIADLRREAEAAGTKSKLLK